VATFPELTSATTPASICRPVLASKRFPAFTLWLAGSSAL
jgi:hypothetical protein